MMSLSVTLPDGAEIRTAVDLATCTVRAFKESVAVAAGVPPALQRVTLAHGASAELQDCSLLANYGLRSGDALHVAKAGETWLGAHELSLRIRARCGGVVDADDGEGDDDDSGNRGTGDWWATEGAPSPHAPDSKLESLWLLLGPLMTPGSPHPDRMTERCRVSLRACLGLACLAVCHFAHSQPAAL